MSTEQDVYYLCISGMQKAVRRGRADDAVRLARIAWRIDQFRLYKRLWTVIFEESGGDSEVVHTVAQWKGTYKDFSTFEPLIRAAADSNHYKGIVLVALMLRGQLRGEEWHSKLEASGNIRLLEAIKWLDDSLSFYYEIMPKNDHFIPDVCLKYAKMDYEGMWKAVPFFHLAETKIIRLPDDPFVDDIPKWRGILPLNALDVHTRPGKMVMKMLCKKLHVAIEAQPLVYHLAMSYDTKVLKRTHRVPGVQEAYDMSQGGSIIHRGYIEDFHAYIRPCLYELREWSMRKPFRDTGELFQRMWESL